MWKDISGKTLYDFKRNIHQDYLATFLAIHDEWDIIIDKHLLQPISVKISDILENRKIFSKLGYSFVRFKFDIEFDSEHGSFVPESSMNAFNYSLKRFKRLDDSYANGSEDSSVQQNQTETVTAPITESVVENEEPEIEILKIQINMTKVKEAKFEGVLKILSSYEGVDCELYVEHNGNIYKQDKLLDYSKLSAFIEKSGIPSSTIK